MESRNVEKALEIVSCLIMGDTVAENGNNASLYQEYSTNVQVYDIVHMSLKKMNLNIYEYNNTLFISPGENNRVFGYTNEQLRRETGARNNRELYLAYFIIYHTITEFYSDTVNSTYADFVKLENVIQNVDVSVNGILDKQNGFLSDEVEENSFKQIALSWDELPVSTIEDQSGIRAARNSKSGFVKMVFNFLVDQELLFENGDRFYPTDRFKALIENYFDEYRGRLTELLSSRKGDEQNATDKQNQGQ